MNIVVGSAFRNSLHYHSRYFKQVEALREFIGPGHSVRVIAAEGDSKDATRKNLAEMPQVELVDASHGGPHYGSTEQPERMALLSKVGNSIFEHVSDSDDVLLYVESDLLWTPQVAGELIKRAYLKTAGFDVFAPFIFAGQYFYDVWAFRKNGSRFAPFPPYHSGLNGDFNEVDSVGSCLAMRREVAEKCRIRNDYALVGWCEDARSQGYRIAACSDLQIYHP